MNIKLPTKLYSRRQEIREEIVNTFWIETQRVDGELVTIIKYSFFDEKNGQVDCQTTLDNFETYLGTISDKWHRSVLEEINELIALNKESWRERSVHVFLTNEASVYQITSVTGPGAKYWNAITAPSEPFEDLPTDEDVELIFDLGE